MLCMRICFSRWFKSLNRYFAELLRVIDFNEKSSFKISMAGLFPIVLLQGVNVK